MTTSKSYARSVIQWWRLVAPPTALWLALVLVFCVIEGFVFWIARLLGDWNEALRLHEIRDGGVLMFAWFYGVLRVLLHHPLFNAEYREFLAASPWQRNKPLPLGPVRLALQDLVVLGVLVAVMAIQNRLPLVMPLVAFLAGYLMMLASTLSRTGEWWIALGVWFGLGLTVRMAWWNPWAAAAVLMATTLVSQFGLWRSWLRFPWTQELTARRRTIIEYDWRKAVINKRRKSDDLPDVSSLWPHSGLGFLQPARALELLPTWMSAAVVGWWIYAVAGPIPVEPQEVHSFALFTFTVVTGIIAVGRLLIYAMGHHAPLSFFGRLATRSYFIPAYDIVLVTPLLVAVTGLPAYFGLFLVGVPAATSFAITAALVIGLACTGGPRLRAWQLTAPCRIISGTSGSLKDVQVI